MRYDFLDYNLNIHCQLFLSSFISWKKAKSNAKPSSIRIEQTIVLFYHTGIISSNARSTLRHDASLMKLLPRICDCSQAIVRDLRFSSRLLSVDKHENDEPLESPQNTNIYVYINRTEKRERKRECGNYASRTGRDTALSRCVVNRENRRRAVAAADCANTPPITYTLASIDTQRRNGVQHAFSKQSACQYFHESGTIVAALLESTSRYSPLIAIISLGN